MADEFNTTTNWWDSSRTTASSSSSVSSALNTTTPTTNTLVSFGWATDNTNRSSIDSPAQPGPSDSPGSDLHLMGLGLDWNQALLRGDKSDGGFRSMLEQQNQFSEPSSESSVTCHQNFQMDTSNLYHQVQGLLGSDHHSQFGTSISYGDQHQHQQQQQQVLMSSNWSGNNASNSKIPPFLRPQQQNHGQLHFSNNTPFWNASGGGGNDSRSGFFPSLQSPLYPSPPFDDKPKHGMGEVRETSSVVKKSEAGSKRPRNETTANLPAFKVRKEKMGDRITALQQLVSPFGKTDTASVLSEAIEYIKFLHEQVAVLSTPYMKSGATIQQHQQSCDKSKESEGPKQDLRSRGLCLVPVSSTYPVTHESAVDFWTPTFGGTYR